MILYTENKRKKVEQYTPNLLSREVLDDVQSFHEQQHHYKATDLVRLQELADYLGVAHIFIKDESTRFAMNSFKILGAAYAVGKALKEKLNVTADDLSLTGLKELLKHQEQKITLAATTDGNHGKGVAWMGKELGLDVVIYMPKGTTTNRLNHILELGAKAFITDMNYDETVRYVASLGKEKDWLVIQDTAWEGYEKIPKWIMQGYSTIARECNEQLADIRPTHIFLQAGVGAFAGVIAEAFYYLYTKEDRPLPKIVVIEAAAANCYYIEAKEGIKRTMNGELKTIMAGLACGEANPIGQHILFQLAEGFVSAPDWSAANGMRILGNPLKGDRTVTSGESGAVSIGVLERIMKDDTYSTIREQLGLGKESSVLTFSTEGDTDHAVYREIVWYGNYARVQGGVK